MDEKSVKYKTLLKDTVIFAIGSIGSKIILFLLVPLYTNILTTEEYGISDLFHTVAEILYPIFCLTIFNAVIRFGLSQKVKTEDVLVNGLIVCVFGAIITISCYPFTIIFTPLKEWGWHLVVFIISLMFLEVELNYLKIKDKNKLFAIICLIQTSILAVTNIITIAFLRVGTKGYIYSYVISTFIALIIPFCFSFTRQDIKNGKFNKSLIADMMKYSSPLVLTALSWMIIHSSDKLMIEGMIGVAALGLYTSATKIPALINVLSNVFSQAWGITSIKEIESTNDNEFYSEVFSLFSTLLFAISMVIISFIKPIMSVYVGKDFAPSWVYVPLLLVAAVFSAISGYFSSMYAALKKSLNNMVCTMMCALINVIVNYLGIKNLGITGAVIGTIVSFTLLAYIKMFDVKRYIDIKINVIFYVNSILVIVQAILIASKFSNLVIIILVPLLFFVINSRNLLKIIKKIEHFNGITK